MVIGLAIFFTGVYFIQPSYAGYNILIDQPYGNSLYTPDDPLIVSGKLGWNYQDNVIIQILDPNNVVVRSATTSDYNEVYSQTFSLKGLDKEGQYTIVVYYHNMPPQHAYFRFTDPNMNNKGNIVTSVDGTDILINHSPFDGNITEIIPYPKQNVLIFKMSPNQGGIVAIELPRGLLDASLSGTDIPYSVKLNGLDSIYTETDTPNSRILSVGFAQNTFSIEIIGTNLNLNYNIGNTYNSQLLQSSSTIPEFGSLLGVIIIVSIISVIIISKKSNLHFL